MNLLLISNDNHLLESIQNMQLFSDIDVRTVLDDLEYSLISKYNVIMISDVLVDIEEITYLRSKLKDQIIFYLLSKVTKRGMQSIEALAHSSDIEIIYQNQTMDSVMRHIKSILKPTGSADKNKVAGFFGTHPQAGVTATIMSVAEKLSLLTDAKICVLSLNPWNSGDLFCNYKGSYLDEFTAQLANRLLSPSEFFSNIGKCNNFSIMGGNRDIKKIFKYYDEEIQYLIDTAKQAFDLVLIDAGSNFDNAMAVRTLYSTDVNFVVTTQQRCGYYGWSQSFRQVLEPLGFYSTDFLLILNKYREIPGLLTAKQIAQEYKISLLRNLPDLGPLGLSAEQKKSSLLNFNDKEYNNDINSLANTLMKIYSLTSKISFSAHIPKKSFLQLFFGSKGA